MLDLTGQKYGKLYVIDKTDKKNHRNEIIWNCLCDCGNKKETSTSLLRGGKCKSCGCLKHQEPPNKIINRYDVRR